MKNETLVGGGKLIVSQTMKWNCTFLVHFSEKMVQKMKFISCVDRWWFRPDFRLAENVNDFVHQTTFHPHKDEKLCNWKLQLDQVPKVIWNAFRLSCRWVWVCVNFKAEKYDRKTFFFFSSDLRDWLHSLSFIQSPNIKWPEMQYQPAGLKSQKNARSLL